MTTSLSTGRRRKQRQRRLLWAIVLALVVPLAFMPFEAWLAMVIIGVFLAIPALGFSVALGDMLYGMTGGYDRHAQSARDRFESFPPLSDSDIPAAVPDAQPRKKRKRRKPKIRIAWFRSGWSGSARSMRDDL